MFDKSKTIDKIKHVLCSYLTDIEPISIVFYIYSISKVLRLYLIFRTHIFTALACRVGKST